MLLNISSTVTVKGKLVPGVAVDGADTEKCVALPGRFASEKFTVVRPFAAAVTL